MPRSHGSLIFQNLESHLPRRQAVHHTLLPPFPVCLRPATLTSRMESIQELKQRRKEILLDIESLELKNSTARAASTLTS